MGTAAVVIIVIVALIIFVPKLIRYMDYKEAYNNGLSAGRGWVKHSAAKSTLNIWFTPPTVNLVLREAYEKGFAEGCEAGKLAEARRSKAQEEFVAKTGI